MHAFRMLRPDRATAALPLAPLLLLLGLASGSPAAAQEQEAGAQDAPPVALREWTVPWPRSRPRDPFAASAESVWFVGQVDHYLAHLDVERGAFEKLELPDAPGPHNLIVDEAGVVWYAGNLKGYIGRYDPDAGEAGGPGSESGLAPASAIEKIPMPDPAAEDPHTLTFGPDGHIWFSVQGGNFVGRLEPESREVELVRVPTPNARPYGIEVAPTGVVWVALFGTHKLARVDPETLELTEHPLPREDARPRRLGLTSDGRVWYVDYVGGRLGAYDPEADAFREWPLPSGEEALPYGMAVDDRDRIWLVETGPEPNRFVGFDPGAGPGGEGAFLGSTPVPSGGATIRHMHFHAPSRTIWFGTDANTIGRATLDPERETSPSEETSE